MDGLVGRHGLGGSDELRDLLKSFETGFAKSHGKLLLPAVARAGNASPSFWSGHAAVKQPTVLRTDHAVVVSECLTGTAVSADTSTGEHAMMRVYFGELLHHSSPAHTVFSFCTLAGSPRTV